MRENYSNYCLTLVEKDSGREEGIIERANTF